MVSPKRECVYEDVTLLSHQMTMKALLYRAMSPTTSRRDEDFGEEFLSEMLPPITCLF